MKIKDKAWYWIFTFPFAHKNATTLGNTIYKPKGVTLSSKTIAHETMHIVQQNRVGILKYLFLYLLCGPFLWNPWRWKWEMEAYVNGSRLKPEEANKILMSYKYGWLRNGA